MLRGRTGERLPIARPQPLRLKLDMVQRQRSHTPSYEQRLNALRKRATGDG
jgi:hypothetical protein